MGFVMEKPYTYMLEEGEFTNFFQQFHPAKTHGLLESPDCVLRDEH